MGYTVSAKCPSCRASYSVSGSTDGMPNHPSDCPHCFNCERCGNQVVAVIPSNAHAGKVSVRRDKQWG